MYQTKLALCVILISCVYLNSANLVKRQADMGSGAMDSSSQDSSSPGSTNSGSDEKFEGLFIKLKKLLAGLPFVNMFLKPITNPIFDALDKYIG